MELTANRIDLWYAFKNASLFARPKTWNGGEVRLEVLDDELQVTASDDFVSVTTIVYLLGEPWPLNNWFIGHKRIKELEKILRESTDATINLDLNAHEDVDSTEPEWWEEYDKVMQNAGKGSRKILTWSLNPERVALLNRLEPKGEYPLNWLSTSHGGEPFWAFRYGPKVLGMLVPLDYDKLEEHHHWMWEDRS